jgi:5'/3'-nucleotidase SurE
VVYPTSPPDLVVSGINPGNNTATSGAGLHSGTVAAVQTASAMGIPGIAISVASNAATPGLVAQLLAPAAETVITIIRALDQARNSGHESLMPAFRALNVNYPAAQDAAGNYDPALVNGYAWTRLTTKRPPLLNYRPSATVPDLYDIILTSCNPDSSPCPNDPGSDATALGENKISVTPLDSDATADDRPWKGLRKLVKG